MECSSGGGWLSGAQASGEGSLGSQGLAAYGEGAGLSTWCGMLLLGGEPKPQSAGSEPRDAAMSPGFFLKALVCGL